MNGIFYTGRRRPSWRRTLAKVVAVLCVAALVGGVVVLASMDPPSVREVEQVILDENFPH